jgi:hypothetical protein
MNELTKQYTEADFPQLEEHDFTTADAVVLFGGATALGGITAAGLMAYAANKVPVLLDLAVNALEVGAAGAAISAGATAYRQITR